MATEDFFTNLNPVQHFGMTSATAPGGQSAAGAGLPASSATATAGDGGDKPWHPDSPLLWLAIIAAASLAGIVGASVNLHAGPARAGAKIGK